MKRICLVVFILVVIFILFFACENNEKNGQKYLSEISVLTKDSRIKLEIKARALDIVDYEDSQLFQAIINNNSVIPYVELGEVIQIEFKGKVPDTYEFKEYILKEDGTLKYEKSTIETININIKNKIASFTLNPNIWTSLSSHTDDYEVSAVIRGFRLLCDWNGEKYEYVFILNTDAQVEM